MVPPFPFVTALTQLSPFFRADFVGRLPGHRGDTDKEAALAPLRSMHERAAQALGFSKIYHAGQPHGRKVAVATPDGPSSFPDADALISISPGVCLGIHVADCGPLYLVDAKTGALGLIHSGRKGTEKNITGETVTALQKHFGSQPEDLHAFLGPCLRPPHYEVNFAAQIIRQAEAAGIPKAQVHDSGLCTSDLSRFYSYRLEKGRTGRLLALLGRVDK